PASARRPNSTGSTPPSNNTSASSQADLSRGRRGPAAASFFHALTTQRPNQLTPKEKESSLMKLTDQLTDYINAAFTGLWVQTQEPDEAEREIIEHARQHKWKLAAWDIAGGLRVPGANTK